MKKIFAFAIFLTIAINSFCQQTDSSRSIAKTDYLQKSKNQKTTAIIMAAGGVALVTTGAILASDQSISSPEFGSGVGLFAVGIAATVASIPFFISSAKNKGRAMSASANFKMQTLPAVQRGSFANKSYPALGIKMNF